MQNPYSKYFELLYDQKEPVGSLGRGTHYSVFRAPCWQTPDLEPRSAASFHDFAVIWDEDHDERIVEFLEKIYFAGFLPAVVVLGERKGTLSVLVSPAASPRLMARGLEVLRRELAKYGNLETDSWVVEVSAFGAETKIIHAERNSVELYLRNIDMLWQLGSHDRG